MNETFKRILINNAGTILVALCGAFITATFFIFSFLLSLRADVNSTQFQVQALQQSDIPLNALIPEVATIKQASIDTNEKVNALYSHFLNK